MRVAGGLLRAHVARRTEKRAHLREKRFSRNQWPCGFCQTEVDDSRHGLTIHFSHKNVGRLQIAMDDGFLVGMLYAPTNSNDQLETFANAELLGVAVIIDGKTLHVLHNEVRLPGGRGAGIENFGDGRMIHYGQRLLLRLESQDSGRIVDSGLDQLESHVAVDWMGLLGEPYLSHPADTQFLHETVGTDDFRLRIEWCGFA